MAKGDSKLRNRKRLEKIVPKNVISEEAFLSKYGVSARFRGYFMDKVGHATKSTREDKRRKDIVEQLADDYGNKRAKYKRIYNQQVAKGNIVKPSSFQSALIKAQGHGDNESVRAARRVVAKYGYDWKTGNKLKKQGD